MKFFWTFRSLPELNHLTEDEKSRVIRSAAPLDSRIGLSGTVVSAGLCAGTVAAGIFAGGMGLVAISLTFLIAALLGGVLMFQFQMRRIRLSLRLFLFEHFRGRKLPVCLRCGYDLTGNATDRCPECGANVVMPEK